MRIPVRICCFLIMTHILCTTASAAENFIVGVAPHTSARVILEMYQPLRKHLEKSLGYTVDIVTAPDFNEFAKRGLSGAYDLAVPTAYQARLFQTDGGYIPLLTYKADFKAVVLVPAKGPIKKPSDLNGKNIIGLSPTSQVTIWGKHWLEKNHIQTATIKYVSASDSAAQLVVAGEAAAGFTSLANFQKLPPALQKQLRFLSTSKSMAGRVYVLNSRRNAERKKIDAALWSFADSTEGKKYFQDNHLDGYRKLKPRELNTLDRYAVEIRKVLQGKAP